MPVILLAVLGSAAPLDAQARHRPMSAASIIARVGKQYGDAKPRILHLEKTQTDSTPHEVMYFVKLSGYFRRGRIRAQYLYFSALANRWYVWGVQGYTTSTSARTRPTSTPTRTPRPTATPTTTPVPGSGYSASKAVAYADTYWSTYNSQYPSFANQGGDCTNFVSQALYAGGISMRTSPPYYGNAAWFISSSGGQWSYSTPWVNSQDNSTFLLHGLSGVTQVASYVGVAPGQVVASHAVAGDVVLYDWNNDGIYDHNAIISTSDGQSVDAHTSDRFHQYWTLAQYNSQWQTTRVTVLHVPSGTQ